MKYILSDIFRLINDDKGCLLSFAPILRETVIFSSDLVAALTQFPHQLLKSHLVVYLFTGQDYLLCID